MKLRWSPLAADDLEQIVDHVRKDSPTAAQRVALAIYEGIGRLREYPLMGRLGREEGSRELVFPGLPYLAVYRVRGEEVVEISRILHGRQRWP